MNQQHPHIIINSKQRILNETQPFVIKGVIRTRTPYKECPIKFDIRLILPTNQLEYGKKFYFNSIGGQFNGYLEMNCPIDQKYLVAFLGPWVNTFLDLTANGGLRDRPEIGKIQSLKSSWWIENQEYFMNVEVTNQEGIRYVLEKVPFY